LDPADEGQPKYVLAETLRGLLPLTGAKNCADYARLYFVHTTTVSKALGGKEIPTWHFIRALVENVVRASGAPHLLPDYLATLEGLYDNAIADSPKKVHITQRLIDEIAQRDEVVEELTAELRAYNEALEDLASSARAMRTGKVQPLNNASEPGFVQQGIEIEQMRVSVQKSITELSGNLEWHHQRLAEAEHLAQSYERLYGERLEAAGADDETELLNLDGLRQIGGAGEVIPVELADTMRSELEERIVDLEHQLKLKNDEVQHLRTLSLRHPVSPQPARHRRREVISDPLLSQGDMLPPQTEWPLDSHG
jgi:hypothetical protein